MNRFFLSILTLVALGLSFFASSAKGEESFAKRQAEVGRFSKHHLTVTLTPSKHRIYGEDRIELIEGSSKQIEFLLHRDLTLEHILVTSKTGAEVVKAEKVELKENQPEHLTRYRVAVADTAREIYIVYSGSIYDPIKEAKTLAFVRGDETSGIIGDEGIYLDAGSGWYPREDKGLSSYELTAYSYDGFTLVAQGDLVRREADPNYTTSVWKTDVPQDGFTLVGNKFVVKSRQVGEVLVGAYFFEEDSELADIYIDSAAKFLDFYTKLLGKFPYNRFDIVENFFQTGYGMPGYTLLGNAVIQRVRAGGYEEVGAGGIGHELVHNWWGNYVFFDADEGNWCEALTTYLTNYYWLEASGEAEKARDWRKRACVKYSINVPPEKAYPLRDFKGKENEIDGAIGYEKGAMFFHAIRRLIGDKPFFGGLRDVIQTRGGSFATWEDFKGAFKTKVKVEKPEQAYLLDYLDDIFQDWLNSPDAPRIFVDSVINEPGYFKFTVALAEPFFIPVELVGYDAQGAKTTESQIYLSSGPAYFSLESEQKKQSGELMGIMRVEIDPQWHTFRRVPEAALEPCLNATLNEKDALVVYPSGTDEMATELIKLVPIIEQSGKSLRIIPDVRLEDELKKDGGKLKRSIFILGGESVNCAWKVIRPLIPTSSFNAAKKSFSVGRSVYSGENESILISFANSEAPGKFISVYHGNSVKALARERMIFYYGWDSWVLFREGRVAERGMFPALENPWVWLAE